LQNITLGNVPARSDGAAMALSD